MNKLKLKWAENIKSFVLKHLDWIKKKQELVKNVHVAEDFDKNQIKTLNSMQLLDVVVEHLQVLQQHLVLQTFIQLVELLQQWH